MVTKLENKDGKRKSISKENALELLADSVGDMFIAYFDAVEKFNIEIQQTIPEARTRLNAVLLNAKLVESFVLRFPENWIKGKYGRIIFRWDEVQMMIKKLNANGKPSYIPTVLSEKIENQIQAELFEGDDKAKEEPLLIFGYTKDKFGCISNPRIVYYNGEVKWSIFKSDIMLKPVSMEVVEDIQVLIKKVEKKKAE